MSLPGYAEPGGNPPPKITVEDGIHGAIEEAINTRLDTADTLLREANSLMRSNPEKWTQVEIAPRKEQYP